VHLSVPAARHIDADQESRAKRSIGVNMRYHRGIPLRREIDLCCTTDCNWSRTVRKNPEPTRQPPRQQGRRPRRNKLVYKNRWLLSVNIVAALRRAGVACDIIVPSEVAPAPEASATLAQETSGDDAHASEPAARKLH
jgi:hypothetical protein